MNATIVAIIVSAVLVGGAIVLTKGNSQSAITASANNVTTVDGNQIIEIKAKGGYLPIKSTAKANMPTILRVNTDGTFDCSASVRIPSMSVNKNLPASGTTDIDIGSQKVSTLTGTCGMGMYPFEINFQG